MAKFGSGEMLQKKELYGMELARSLGYHTWGIGLIGPGEQGEGMPRYRGETGPMIGMWSQLSGCAIGRTFEKKEDAELAILTLSGCKKHSGVHHFAVVDEGLSIAMSVVGWECVQEAIAARSYVV